MAFNVLINSGSTTTVLTDGLTDATLGTGQIQYVKLMDGTVGSSNKLLINSTGAAATFITGSLPAGVNSIGTVQQAPITKGVQGTTGVNIQSLHDGGRVYITLTLDAVTGVTAEALATMTINKSGSVTTGTSYTVTAGKTFRIQFFGTSVKNTSTVASNSRVRVRSSSSVTATSGILIANECGTVAAIASASATDDSNVPEGIEVAGGQQVGISHIETATTCTTSACLIGFEY